MAAVSVKKSEANPIPAPAAATSTTAARPTSRALIAPTEVLFLRFGLWALNGLSQCVAYDSAGNLTLR
jgi:hypothetical protein